VRRFGGFVAKYMGDGVLVYFGYPQAMKTTLSGRFGRGWSLWHQ
jgi:class 3 adenylate cyclase